MSHGILLLSVAISLYLIRSRELAYGDKHVGDSGRWVGDELKLFARGRSAKCPSGTRPRGYAYPRPLSQFWERGDFKTGSWCPGGTLSRRLPSEELQFVAPP